MAVRKIAQYRHIVNPVDGMAVPGFAGKPPFSATRGRIEKRSGYAVGVAGVR